MAKKSRPGDVFLVVPLSLVSTMDMKWNGLHFTLKILPAYDLVFIHKF